MIWFCGINGAKCFGMFLDENQNVVSKDNCGNDLFGVGNVRRICFTQGIYAYSTTFTSPTNAKYFKWYFTAEYGTTYKNDVCFQLSTETNTKYVPYTHNELTRTGKVDLGSLNWNNPNEYGRSNCQFQLTDAIGGVDKGFSINYNYDVQVTYNPPKNKTIFIHPSNKYIYICDSAFIGKTGAEVKALLSGVYLDYETNTPMELRSAGTVKDLLWNCSGNVERKCGTRAYQSGDENNPSVITDGTTTIYPLATPTTEQHPSIAIPKLATKCTDANGMEIDIERNN